MDAGCDAVRSKLVKLGDVDGLEGVSWARTVIDVDMSGLLEGFLQLYREAGEVRDAERVHVCHACVMVFETGMDGRGRRLVTAHHKMYWHMRNVHKYKNQNTMEKKDSRISLACHKRCDGRVV